LGKKNYDTFGAIQCENVCGLGSWEKGSNFIPRTMWVGQWAFILRQKRELKNKNKNDIEDLVCMSFIALILLSRIEKSV